MLSDLQVRQAKTSGKAYALADFDGLYLHISANGFKAWHFRFTWGGKRERMSFGGYPALSLKDARHLRDEARAMLAKGINPHSERKRKRHAIVLAGEHTFQAIYDKWLAHRSLSLENEGRQSTPKQIGRVFAKDVFPVLRHLTVYDVTRAHLLDIIGRVEKRGSLSVAEKLRTWFSQLFTYASVVVPNMGDNPAKDLDGGDAAAAGREQPLFAHARAAGHAADVAQVQRSPEYATGSTSAAAHGRAHR